MDYRIGAIWNGELEINLSQDVGMVLGEKGLEAYWDVLFDIKDNGIDVVIFGDYTLEFELASEEKEIFIDTWTKLLISPERVYNIDLIDVKNFLFSDITERKSKASYVVVKNWRNIDLEGSVKNKALVLFTGVENNVCTVEEIIKYIGNKEEQVMFQSINNDKRRAYIWCVD